PPERYAGQLLLREDEWRPSGASRAGRDPEPRKPPPPPRARLAEPPADLSAFPGYPGTTLSPKRRCAAPDDRRRANAARPARPGLRRERRVPCPLCRALAGPCARSRRPRAPPRTAQPPEPRSRTAAPPRRGRAAPRDLPSRRCAPSAAAPPRPAPAAARPATSAASPGRPTAAPGRWADGRARAPRR